ncbi:MAG: hypothetical protein ACP5G7_06710, partial [Anaerolineae bacterium]
ITHAAPQGIHDADDLCHQGFGAFLWLMDVFKPRYLVHGHIHLYRQDAPRVTRYGDTLVVNTFGYQVIDIDVDAESSGEASPPLPRETNHETIERTRNGASLGATARRSHPTRDPDAEPLG